MAREWKPATPNYEYVFPRDHGSHPEYKIEWWYYTGNVHTSEGRRFGYQLTFFRIGAVPEVAAASSWALRDVWMAHFAVSDLAAKEYHHADRLNRAGPGLAGASTQRVWNEDWSCEMTFPQGFPESGKFLLQASDASFGIKLSLESGKKPVIHGRDGISQKGATAGNASHYYSMTRMPAQGTVTLAGKDFAVTGDTWMDHEFGSSFLEKGQQGWDWFSAQLSDGSELMLFQLRQTVGGAETPNMSAGTLIKPDGSVLPLASTDFRLTPGATWPSPSQSARYPIDWTIEIPRQQLSLRCRAVIPSQEFASESTPGLNYWEGAVDYQGSVGKTPITGHGYLEMTGYGGQAMSVWFGAQR